MTVQRITPTHRAHSAEGPQDPGPGEHLWFLLAGYRFPDETLRRMAEGTHPGDMLMDAENLIIVQGPGCYKCEEPFSRTLYYRKCTGTMEHL